MGIHPFCHVQDGHGGIQESASPARESHWMQVRQSKEDSLEGRNYKRPHLVEVPESGGGVNVATCYLGKTSNRLMFGRYMEHFGILNDWLE
jgi:hypothetical protein